MINVCTNKVTSMSTVANSNNSNRYNLVFVMGITTMPCQGMLRGNSFVNEFNSKDMSLVNGDYSLSISKSC